MKKYGVVKRVLSIAVCASMTMTLTACEGKKGQQENVAGKGGNTSTDAALEYVYIPEYVSFGGESDENTWLGDFKVQDNMVYYTVNTYVEEDSDAAASFIMKKALTGDSEAEICLENPNDMSIHNFDMDNEGNLEVVFGKWLEEEETSLYGLGKYDSNGNEIFNVDISDIVQSDEENSYIQGIAVDEKGRIYAFSENLIRLFDEQGQFAGEIKISADWCDNIFADSNGKVYITYYDFSKNTMGKVLAEVDFDGKKIGKIYENVPDCNSVFPAEDGSLFACDAATLYKYDLNSESSETILKWLDSDINGEYVASISYMDDGKLLAVIRDWNTDKVELAILTKTKADEVKQKIELTIGTYYTDQSLQDAAVAFNKENDKYRVKVKTYMDDNFETEWSDILTQVNNDIASGSAPDLLDLSLINTKKVTDKNVLEDLTPYLEKSSALSKDDILPAVLEAYTINDELVGIPSSVYIACLVGKNSVIGERKSWSLEEMKETAAQYPGAQLINGADKEEVLYMCLIFNEDYFIDWNSGTCNFDTPEFAEILEFVNSFPDEIDWDNLDDSAKLYQENKVLFQIGGATFEELQWYEAQFGEPVSFVGYPTVNGGSGTVMFGESAYGINAASQNKEGAWEFIEFLLNYENAYEYGIPSLKKKLDKVIEDVTKEEYVYDENGEILLDENGEPVLEGSGDGIWMEDGTIYEYRQITQEDVDRILSLMEGAVPISDNFDEEIINIITEEAGPYFHGQKSVEDVTKIIQNRLQNYVSENS